MNKLLGAIVATVTIAGCVYFSSKPASSQKTDNPTISYLDSDLIKLSDVNGIALPTDQKAVRSTIALNNQGNMIPDILAAHNKYRTQVGIPPLKWSNKIASSAQTWANQLAKMGKMQHSTSQARSGYGENLWMGTAGAFSFTQMVDGWGSEKKNFIPNKAFPNVSKTGNWADVGHYTQIVWKNTTEVGCALTQGGGNNYLVCQYNPPGNFQGQKPY
ncbi:MAG: CAP domain-containing protein [Microcoleaceae cyanobacterium]|jgi:uncharacterized protein YkwD